MVSVNSVTSSIYLKKKILTYLFCHKLWVKIRKCLILRQIEENIIVIRFYILNIIFLQNMCNVITFSNIRRSTYEGQIKHWTFFLLLFDFADISEYVEKGI